MCQVRLESCEVHRLGCRGPQKPILQRQKSGASGSRKIQHCSYKNKYISSQNNTSVQDKNRIFLHYNCSSSYLVYTSQYIAAFVLASVVCSLSSWLDVVCGGHHFWIAEWGWLRNLSAGGYHRHFLRRHLLCRRPCHHPHRLRCRCPCGGRLRPCRPSLPIAGNPLQMQWCPRRLCHH